MSVAATASGRVPHYLEAGKGIKSWLVTLDHKRIGVMYLWSVLGAFLLGGLAAILVRTELWSTGQTIMDANAYNRMFTLHGAAMVFLFIIPSVPAALGNILLPIMLGAKDVAFPRLNLASYYIYLVGALFALAAIAFGGVDTGWTFYTPYSTSDKVANTAVMMTFAAFVLGFSSIFTGINFIVTVHKLRAPGITWFRMPLFVWAIYSTAILQVLATPVLAITLLLFMVERTFGIGIFDATIGGDPVLFQHFFWFYSHPAVYIMILPGMGIISELTSTFSRRPIFGYTAVAFSSVALAIFSFLVWGHHMFVSGQSEYASALFSFLTFFVALPSGVKMFNWLGTMYKGSISFASPNLYAMAFMFLFSIGGLTGIFLGALSTDVHLTDSYFVVAHFHYVMMGGTIFAFFGGIHYWWPKTFGVTYNEGLAKIAVALQFIGFNITFFSQFILGTRGMPRRYFNYPPDFEELHRISTIGSYIVFAGFLLTAWYLIASLRKEKNAGDNPWHSVALEWQTSSPPPVENFVETPKIKHGPYDYDHPDAAPLVLASASSNRKAS
ncbi:MAG: cytochrome c oxidase subunit I [Deltaproteobacteria bacterium]|nr:cytochrome c oxidase subunit I [Deltaproteobacteria bacterium]